MADTPEIAYRFTPPFDGAHLRGVPQRDLTQQDIARLPADLRRDALTPHPGYGTPLYTAVTDAAIEQQALFAAAALAPEPIDTPVAEPVELAPETHVSADAPKWFRDRQEKAGPGVLLPDPLPGETQKAYDERVARFAPEQTGTQDGDA